MRHTLLMPVYLPARLARGPLTVRLWEPADAAAMSSVVGANMAWLRPWMPWCRHEPLSIEQRRELITVWREAFERGEDATYGIFLDGRPVGGTGLHQRIGPGGLEIGCWVDEHVTRRRIALTTAALLAAAGLSTPGVERIEWLHAVENLRSEGVARALGFRKVGVEPREPLAPGLGGEVAIWRITQRQATPELRDRWARQQVRRGSPRPAGTPGAVR